MLCLPSPEQADYSPKQMRYAHRLRSGWLPHVMLNIHGQARAFDPEKADFFHVGLAMATAKDCDEDLPYGWTGECAMQTPQAFADIPIGPTMWRYGPCMTLEQIRKAAILANPLYTHDERRAAGLPDPLDYYRRYFRSLVDRHVADTFNTLHFQSIIQQEEPHERRTLRATSPRITRRWRRKRSSIHPFGIYRFRVRAAKRRAWKRSRRTIPVRRYDTIVFREIEPLSHPDRLGPIGEPRIREQIRDAFSLDAIHFGREFRSTAAEIRERITHQSDAYASAARASGDAQRRA